MSIITDRLKEKLKSASVQLIAEPELSEERINICNTCENLSGIRNCKKCGCFVDAKAKLKKSACPIGKW